MNPIYSTLERDHWNVDVSIKVFRKHEILDLLERLETLFTTLGFELNALNKDLLECDKPSLFSDEAKFRLYMLQSSSMEFLHATAHLLRGHSYAVFPHLRTMIEAAGQAYLSLSDPEIVSLYFDIKKREDFKRRTTSSKILPTTDENTKILNKKFAICSKIAHNNFVSLVLRHEQNTQVEDNEVTYTSVIKFHDTDEPNNVLRHARWLIDTTFAVLTLLAKSFPLPDCVWHRRMEYFDVDARRVLSALHDQLKIDPSEVE